MKKLTLLDFTVLEDLYNLEMNTNLTEESVKSVISDKLEISYYLSDVSDISVNEVIPKLLNNNLITCSNGSYKLTNTGSLIANKQFNISDFTEIKSYYNLGGKVINNVPQLVNNNGINILTPEVYKNVCELIVYAIINCSLVLDYKKYNEYCFTDDDDIKMYFVVNKEIKMSKAKLSGQIGHAVQAYEKHIKQNYSEDVYDKLKDIYAKYNVKIVLGSNECLVTRLESQGFTAIRDKGFTQIAPDTLTAINVGVLNKNSKDFPLFLKDLKLL